MTRDPPWAPLGFEEAATPFDSASQRARVWTEGWVANHLFCAHCGEPRVSQYVANKPVADFHCPACGEDYELKSQKGRFGARVGTAPFAPCVSGWSRRPIPTCC